jgi:hypothetical protein
MKRKALLFGITLVLIVSLLPLAGVSARESSPASSEAAATVLKKTIKTKGMWYESNLLAAKYVQKITWWYNGSRVKALVVTNKGDTYTPPDWIYNGYAVWAESGGAGHKGYYRSTHGYFYSPYWDINFFIDIEQYVYADGSSSHEVWFYPFDTHSD